ncbi:MAG: DegT/DnrJ/EryC1/StrS family aminotransferase [Dehalococcoidia bacterium]
MTTEATPPLAVDGGAPLRAGPYPPAPVFAPAADADPVRALEAEFAALLGVTREGSGAGVLAYGSHEAAYAAAMAVAGVTGGEVVVPALLGRPLATAAAAAGALVVPAEVETDIAALSARGLARAVSEQTTAVGVAHAFGHPAAMTEILAVAAERGVPVIEDASDAVGAAYRGRPAGTLGVAAVFALGEGHVLSAGAPGLPAGLALLVVPDPARAEVARRALDVAGALDAARAAVALAELRALPASLEVRRQLAWELTFNLRGMRAVVGMPHSRWVHHAYDRYVVRLRGLLWKRPLEETLAAIRAEGVPCEAACGAPLHLDPEVRAALGDDERLAVAHFAASERLPSELIAIPLHANLTSKDMDDVAQVLRKIERWST